ncbi:MAG: stage III sporulation protein AF [Thermaerobacter sp.]|nr:stage III sporulation protein AF [Thermaerobacter sp.]
MIDHIGQWLKVLIVVVLLGNLVDFVLPKGDLKRYGGLVVGLVILATLVSPLWSWLNQMGKTPLALPTAGWTNSQSGFNQVVKMEELHQAEAIVLSMSGVSGCTLTSRVDGSVSAYLVTDGSVSAAQARHYVRAALKVTMGSTPAVEVTVRSRPKAGRP